MPRTPVNAAGYHVPVEGFTQAVTVQAQGTFVFVSGLTSRAADGTVLGIGDLEVQTRHVLESLGLILREAGASYGDVVRIVTYLRDMNGHPTVHALRREYFGDQPPASTTVEVSRLYDPEQLIELEATALVSTGSG